MNNNYKEINPELFKHRLMDLQVLQSGINQSIKDIGESTNLTEKHKRLCDAEYLIGLYKRITKVPKSA